MNVTFRQLRLFQALADTGSVGAAARAMHVTQPTASMQLKEITQAVGLPLYDVISRKVQLTEAGLELAKTARAVATEWDNFVQHVDAMQGLTRGKLRIAVVSTAKYFVPRLLGGFCSRHPDVEIALEVLNRDGVVARLRDNMDDLYIMSRPPTDLDLEDQVFMPNPLVVVAPARDSLTAQRCIPLLDLQKHRFLLREQGSGTRMAVDAHFKAEGFLPQVRLELGSNEALKEAVAAGLGLSVVSQHALHGQKSEHGVAVLDVQGFPIKSNWHVVHLRGKRLSPIAQAFMTHLERKARSWRQQTFAPLLVPAET
nr:LysR family transcriptional regulator [Rhodoferax sp.]